jgi:hypothetical protein
MRQKKKSVAPSIELALLLGAWKKKTDSVLEAALVGGLALLLQIDLHFACGLKAAAASGKAKKKAGV